MRTVIEETAKSAPPVAVVGITMAGISLQDWVYILTLVWLVSQLSYFGFKRWREFFGGRDG